MIYFEKSQPAPDCLLEEKQKKSGSYNCGDVLERLITDFKNKCYICEDKAPTGIQIEHFAPHQGDNELKFDWDNLFLACYHCNQIKSNRFSPLLDCTKIEVDKHIKHHINPYPKEKAEFSIIADSPEAQNTIQLLQAVYNGSTTMKRIEADNLRSRLLKEILQFQALLFDYYNALDESIEDEITQLRRKIAAHLNSNSAFTAFKRWIVRDNEYLSQEFTDYI